MKHEAQQTKWVADLLPNKITEPIGEMIQHGLNTMKQTLETADIIQSANQYDSEAVT